MENTYAVAVAEKNLAVCYTCEKAVVNASTDCIVRNVLVSVDRIPIRPSSSLSAMICILTRLRPLLQFHVYLSFQRILLESETKTTKLTFRGKIQLCQPNMIDQASYEQCLHPKEVSGNIKVKLRVLNKRVDLMADGTSEIK
uniref:Uncharacterized protein n=1 Tax=Wuchereria bancrofti TaxID=6293 RepID=A0AAF5PPZ7_WUCBA